LGKWAAGGGDKEVARRGRGFLWSSEGLRLLRLRGRAVAEADKRTRSVERKRE